jgi:hypothetical protein
MQSYSTCYIKGSVVRNIYYNKPSLIKFCAIDFSKTADIRKWLVYLLLGDCRVFSCGEVPETSSF